MALRNRGLISACVSLAVLVGAETRLAQAASSAAREIETPLHFVENHGQADARADAVARTRSGHVFLTREGAVLAVGGPHGEGAVVRIRVPGGAPSCVELLDETPARVSVFRGPDPARWQRGLRTHARARQAEVYPGIDLVYRGHEGALEYDFVVAPHADPKVIRVAFDGAEALVAQPDGSLRVETGGGAVLQRAPVAWQVVDGARRDVAVRQLVDERGEVRFELGAHDSGRELVIDPLVYSTYLGGTNWDRAFAVHVDDHGHAYVGGYTSSFDFPDTPGAWQDRLEPPEDVFIAKFSASGSLLWATYLSANDPGGSFFPAFLDEAAVGLDVDAEGRPHACAMTGPGFPVTRGALDTTFNGDSQDDTDAFVARLSADGSDLLLGTYLGGRQHDRCGGLTLDGAGNIVVVGDTESPDFPTTFGVADGSLGGSQDLFVTKIEASGARLLWSTYLGGSGVEEWFSGVTNVALDAGGNAYVTAATDSRDYPTTVGAYDRTLATAPDAVVTKIAADGRSLAYSTYLGGRGRDWGQDIAVNARGEAFVTGLTRSRDFPVTRGSYQQRHGDQGMGSDAFVTRLNAAGSALVYSTYLGGRNEDQGLALGIDSLDNAFITGETQGGIPTTADAFSRTIAGAEDAFVIRMNAAGSAVTYSTYIGGASHDQGDRIAVETSSRVTLVGYTFSSDYPTAAAFDPTHGGQYDAFVTRLQF